MPTSPALSDPIHELKTRAEILQRKLNRLHPSALARLRSLPEFRSCSPAELELAAPEIRRRQCLSLVAIELGFSSWQDARALFSGSRDVSDFGTLLYPKRCGGHLNLWYRDYDAAVVGHRAAGGYLLAFRRDFFVADRPFIETLGLDPDDPAWSRLGFDWVRPLDVNARRSLYGTLIAQTAREEDS